MIEGIKNIGDEEEYVITLYAQVNHGNLRLDFVTHIILCTVKGRTDACPEVISHGT